MPSGTDRYWYSAEGLRLHYRDYEGPRDKPPILCIPGLTRNARDFEPVAERYAGNWRVISIELRGRGESDLDPDPSRYKPQYYVADILKLLDQLGIADAVFLGTDATERWTGAQFRAQFGKYFEGRSSAWTYVALQRPVAVEPGDQLAWFAEQPFLAREATTAADAPDDAT